MEEFNSTRFGVIGNAIRKKRTRTSRRPYPESQPLSDGCDFSSLSSTPPSDDMKAGSSDDNSGGALSSKRKVLSLGQCASKFPEDIEKPTRKNKKSDIGLNELYANSSSSRDIVEKQRSGSTSKRSSEGVLAPVNWRNTSKEEENFEPQKTMALNRKGDESGGLSQDGLGNDNKVKKVKLKVGGVTRTIDANAKNSRALDANVARQKSAHKDNPETDNSPPRDKKSGLQGIPWKDFSKVGFTLGRDGPSMKGPGKNTFGKHVDKSDPTRKSKRAPKKRSVDGFDDDDDDDEIRYLEKLKNAKFNTGFGEDEDESSRKHKRLSKFSEKGTLNSKVSALKDGKKRSPSEDTEYEEEDELGSDDEVEGKKKKKARKEGVDSIVEPKREMTLTTRQRALQSGRDSSTSGGSTIEFPDGLNLPAPKKQKEQLSEVDQQLKKAEAAQRRKMQNEKAARESEAEAIRRILGQDSNRKKREDKKKKRVEELAQEKAADELMRASNSIRVVMGPNGTTVTFPNEMGLPSIFDSKPHSYPPPREICAGPSCTNPYKYRDSKTKLPLCSLQCYKAVQGNVQSRTATC